MLEKPSLSYLRAFVTLLVVAHHSSLAYTMFKMPRMPSFATQPFLWTAYPVVDARGWAGFDLFVGWNDTFFMALMFFLSGLFVWPSLQQKGARTFLSKRFVRLGLPFIAIAGFIAPLAYYPSFLLFGGSRAPSAYAATWLSLGAWPVGPGWFLWMLLVFDCIAALLYLNFPRAKPNLAKVWGRIVECPILFFLALTAVTEAAYLPLERIFSSFQWSTLGPFSFQTSRGLLYFIYFFAGVCTGPMAKQAGLFEATGRLARQWLLWAAIAVIAFATEAGTAFLAKPLVAAIFFPISCAASSFFLVAVFTRFSIQSRLADSLSCNAYGVYLLHYPFVVWMQWALLHSGLSPLVKGVSVFIGATWLTCAIVVFLRRSSTFAYVV